MIIGINGKVGSGKDTVGMLIQALTMKSPTDGKGPTRYSEDPLLYLQNYEGKPNLKGGWGIKKFASKLKQIASLLTGIPAEKFEDQEFKKTYLGKEWVTITDHGSDTKYMTVREFLQKLGTDAVREGLHTETWVNALFADYKVQGAISIGQTYSAIDLPNWIITDCRFPNEAAAIRERNGLVIRVVRPGDNKGDLHPSEVAMDRYSFDYIIHNDGNLEVLLAKVKEFMSTIMAS